ncbi:hypothetical protein [Nocardioides ungokensis]|uniref:hypothetical protein n=1 Tax=Nocardioides ungokensis TaxID=1643322 RepID=UPI001C6110D1|nr:hypothetical protein [Nocardioides ungokensis]
MVDVAADHQDPVGVTGHGALHHVGRDALAGGLVEPVVAADHEPAETHQRHHARDDDQHRPDPAPPQGGGVRGVLDDGLCSERGRHDERALQDHHQGAERGVGGGRGQVEGDGADDGGGHRRDRGDDPADDHRHPGRARDQREHGEHREDDAEPGGGTQVAHPPGDQVEGVDHRDREPTGLEQHGLTGPVLEGGQPPRQKQDGHRAQRGRRRPPGGAVAHGAADDDGGRGRDDQAEQEGEEPQARREGRSERQQQRAAPGGAPAAVRLGVGEAQRGVGQPRQQGGDDDGAEAPVTPRAAHDRHERVGGGPPQQQPARCAHRRGEPADHAQEAPGTPQAERHDEDEDRGHHGRRAAPEQRGEGGEGQDVRRGRDRRALAERMPRLGPQAPPVACSLRHG